MPEYPSNKVTAISGAGYGSSDGSLTFGGNVHVEGAYLYMDNSSTASINANNANWLNLYGSTGVNITGSFNSSQGLVIANEGNGPGIYSQTGTDSTIYSDSNYIDLNPNTTALNNSVRIGTNGSVIVYSSAGYARNTLDDGLGNLSTLGNISPGNHLLPKWTAPSIAANPLVSGTVYQNTTGGPIILVVPVTGTAATTAQAAIGPTSTPVAYGGAATVALNALVNVQMIVPQDYYYSLTASGATIGTASVLGL